MRDIYYEEELRYLKEEGARFARRYPQRAGHLAQIGINADTGTAANGGIETLFEGFAFLCAGIRERIDGVLPELAAGLTGLLWPQLLHPVPSLCIAEFKPRKGTLQSGHAIKKGTAMFADPDPNTGVCCQFATTQYVCVNPIFISGVSAVQNAAAGKDALTISFEFDQGIRPDALSLSPVRFFINDSLPAALTIRKMLLCHAESVILYDNTGRAKMLSPQRVFTEGGFGEDENLFPELQNISRPLAMLRDYFAYPERFLFIDVHGLDTLSAGDPPPSTLSLEIRFDRKLSGKVHLTKDSFKLHCTPAINAFRRDAEPILVDGRRNEYRLFPDAARPECYTIHSVESVTGIDSVTGARRVYDRYCKPGGVQQRYYSVRREGQYEDGSLFRDDERAMTISMSGYQTETGRIVKETLHIETWQTNGTLAHKVLSEGSYLRKASPDFPDYITFTNITPPNRPVNPPAGDKYLWTFLSHLSGTYSNFRDAERLKDFLRVYDWAGAAGAAGIASTAGRPEIEAISSVTTKPCSLIVDGAVIRGTEMNVVINEKTAPEESVYLLGSVLARSLSCMMSINTFLKLVFTMPLSGKSFVWHCQSGESLL